MSETDKATLGAQGGESLAPAFREGGLAHAVAWKYSRNYLKGSGPVIWFSAVAALIFIIAFVVWASLASPYYPISVPTGGVLR